MRRQKVKGTGHKQPADVNTEPNFYDMPPIRPGTHALAAYGTGVYNPLQFSAQQTLSYDQQQIPHSPGLHGAAHLLRGFAQFAQSSPSEFQPAFLGPPASQGTGDLRGGAVRSAAEANQADEKRKAVSFLPPSSNV
jgi:hypothetical protein